MPFIAVPLRFRPSLVICAALVALNARAAVVESTWSGDVAGNWSAAGNWTPSAAYPKNAADTYEVSISGASITFSEDIVIDSLALSDGDLNGAHSLSVSPAGGLLFDGFSSLSSGFTLNVTGPFAFADDAAALTNHGTLVFKVSGSSNYTASTATLTNATDGTLALDPTTGITLGGSALSPFRLVNEGLFSAANGASNSVFAPVTNVTGGTIRATANSTLYLSTASNLGGTLQADTGSSIQIYGNNGQTHTLTQLAVTGAGSVSAHSTQLTGSLKSGSLAADTTTFTNTFTVESAATFLWDQQNAFAANSTSLTNHGTVRFRTTADGTYSTASTGSFVNAVDGTVAFVLSGRIGDSDTFPFNLINQGTLLADTGSSHSIFTPVANSGTIRSTAGSTLYLTVASNLGGTLQADTGSSIQLYGNNGQTQTLTQLAVTGAGSVSAHSTQLTGSLKSGSLSVETTTFANTFTVESAATLLWDQQNAFAANTNALTNHGVVRFRTTADGTYSTASTASFVNASAGTVSFSASGRIGDSDTFPFNLINQGTILADTGTAHTIFAPVTNSGTIRATANSTLSLSTASNLGGTLQADTGSSIQLYGNNNQTHTLTQTTITGAGSVSTHSTQLTGSLKTGALSAESTTFTGSFSVESAATLHWGAQNRFAANSDTLLNHGYVLFQTVSTDFPAASTATFINAANGVLAFASGGQIGSASIAPFSLSNYGTVITGTATTNQLRVPATNFGTLNVTVGSTIELGSAFTQNSGEVFVNQGTLTALSGQTLYFNGGTLRAAGGVSAPLSLAYTGLEIGSGLTSGSLAVTGATTFGTGSSLRVDLNGTTQGTGYDRLTVTGAVTLGGDLMVRVSPSFLTTIPGNSFTVLSATSISGAFANVATGQRAKLPNGLGSCLLNVSSTQVVLSNFLSSTLNNFLNTAGVPAALRAYDQDPDGDGISNLMEYALALNPMSADVGGLPTSQVSGGNLTLTYYKQRTDVGYEVITTTTLADPGSWTTTGVTQGIPDANKKVTATVPLTGGKAFLRLRINYAP